MALERKKLEEKQKMNFFILSTYPLLLIILALFLDSPSEIADGLIKIIIHPGVLLVDYIAVGGIGATFVNSALVMLVCMAFIAILGLKINGPLIAGILTAGGFAFIGKNIYNIWPIFIGGLLYAKYAKIEFKTILLPIIFATALSPVVTYFSFEIASIPLGIFFGMLIGFLVPAMMAQMLKFHDGYNLYNIGFTAGILGTFFAAFLRGFGYTLDTQSVLSTEYSNFIMILNLATYSIMLLVVFISNNFSFKGYASLFSRSGRGLSNQIESLGFRGTYANMGFIGLIATAYVFLVKGVYNGPVMAGIMTAVGFAAFGKHPKNSIPIMLGVFIGGSIMKYDVSATGIVIAALFGTTLAPIAGAYGTIPGIIAGILHVAMVNNTGALHAGMNLYNNGFAGGIVAAFLVPVLNRLIKKKIDD